MTIRVGNTATSFADGWDPERFDARSEVGSKKE